MKHLLIIAFVALFTCKASAQKETVVEAGKAHNHIGKRVTVIDSVYGYKVKDDAVFIYLGGMYPKQRLTIIIEEAAYTAPILIEHQIVMATSKVIKQSGGLAMTVTDPTFFFIKEAAKSGEQQQAAERFIAPEHNRPFKTAKEASVLFGKKVYVCDTIYDYKAVNKRLGILYMGDKTNEQTLFIVLKNKNPKSRPEVFVRGQMCLSGTMVRYKGRPAIIWPDFGYRISL